jgi:hypothetical protein
MRGSPGSVRCGQRRPEMPVHDGKLLSSTELRTLTSPIFCKSFHHVEHVGSINREEALHFLLAAAVVLPLDMAARLLMLNFYRRIAFPYSRGKSINRANSLGVLVLHWVIN